MDDRVGSGIKAKRASVRQQQRHGPEGRDLAKMGMPEMRRQQRKQRNAEQHPGKRDTPGQRQAGTLHTGGGASQRGQQQGERAHKQGAQIRRTQDL